MHSPSGCPVKYIIGQRFRFVKGKPRQHLHTLFYTPFLDDAQQDQGDHTNQEMCCHMPRCPYIQGTGVKVTFHHTELVFDLCQPAIFINDLLCIHGQFRSDDLIIPKAFPISGYFVKAYQSFDFRRIQNLPGLLIDAFFFEELPQRFRLDCCDSEIPRIVPAASAGNLKMFCFPFLPASGISDSSRR